MTRKAFLPLLALVALIALACSPATEPTPHPKAPSGEFYSQTDFQVGLRGPAGPAGPPLPTPAPKPYAGGLTLPTTVERMIMRHGYLTLLVDTVAEAADQVGRIAAEMGGYVVSSARQGEGKTVSAQVAIRVPAGRFDEALRALRGLAVRVTAESTSGQDVTEEYTDLQAQLRNLEAAEAKLQEIMGRAEKVEEVLMVYRELTSIQGQIERVKGRMQYLERTSALALITVELRPASSPDPLVPPGWSPADTLKDAARRLAAWGQGLTSALIWAGVLAPVWGTALVATAILGLVARRWWRAFRRVRQAQP